MPEIIINSSYMKDPKKRASFQYLNNGDSGRYWYALYTRPKCEKKIAAELHQLKIDTFLPLVETIKFWSDRKKKIKQPLFPSYIFIYANLKERLISLQPSGVVHMVSFNGRPARILSHEINSIRQILENGYVPENCPYINYGDEVEVIEGPLKGVVGRVIEKRSEHHLIVSLNKLHKSISINIQAAYLRKIESEMASSPHSAFHNFY